jgi:conserved domain protein
MNSKNKSQTDIKSYENKERSRLEWGSNMQVVRKGSGEIAITEGELARFFSVIWRALNYRLQAIQKYSNLHPEEMCASKREIVRGK